MFPCPALARRKLVKSLIFSHVGDEVKCTYVPTNADICCMHAHTQPASESEISTHEAFNLAALPDVYSFAIVRRVSRVKSMFHVKSSSVLLMPVSSLAGW